MKALLRPLRAAALLGTFVLFSAVAHSAELSLPCSERASESSDPRLTAVRPIRAVDCKYQKDELLNRLRRLITEKELPDSVEAVESTLGIPEMTTGYDDPRRADYSMVLYGMNGWKILVSVSEVYSAQDKDPGFVPGLRPTRLNSIKNADLRIAFHFFTVFPESNLCVTLADLIGTIKSAGWERLSMPPATDGAGSSTAFKYGSKAVIFEPQDGSCIENMELEQGRAK
jgi:hypothetical protein